MTSMEQRAAVVLDVGKTLSKLSLWDASGRRLAACSRTNERVDTRAYVALDARGIEEFVADSLSNFGRLAQIDSIVTVGHGAAAARSSW